MCWRVCVIRLFHATFVASRSASPDGNTQSFVPAEYLLKRERKGEIKRGMKNEGRKDKERYTKYFRILAKERKTKDKERGKEKMKKGKIKRGIQSTSEYLLKREKEEKEGKKEG